MKTNIQKNALAIALSLLPILAFTLTSCQKERVAQPAQTDQAVQRSSATSQAVAETNYAYLVGEEPIEGPDKTVASNGDTITIHGEGTLSIHSKSVTGHGEFKHTNAAGTLLASGTWSALELNSFKSFGNSADPTLPPNFEAGLAVIRIHLSPDGGGAGVDALLQITCVLPGAKAPLGFEEGVKVVIQDVINFNKQVFGQTLFIRL
jgi:hypothetical protein